MDNWQYFNPFLNDRFDKKNILILFFSELSLDLW